jgi:hypothetical protein
MTNGHTILSIIHYYKVVFYMPYNIYAIYTYFTPMVIPLWVSYIINK